MAVDRKFKITQNDINKTFDQLKRSSAIWSTDKKSFDQTPNLTLSNEKEPKKGCYPTNNCLKTGRILLFDQFGVGGMLD